jgi:hypothetical protein
MLNDDPARKKFIRSLPRAASPVNVKLSARAEPPRNQTIASERTADLNDSPLIEPPLQNPVPVYGAVDALMLVTCSDVSIIIRSNVKRNITNTYLSDGVYSVSGLRSWSCITECVRGFGFGRLPRGVGAATAVETSP